MRLDNLTVETEGAVSVTVFGTCFLINILELTSNDPQATSNISLNNLVSCSVPVSATFVGQLECKCMRACVDAIWGSMRRLHSKQLVS